MTPDDEIRDRMHRLHDWAQERPHGLVAPPLPPAEVRRPDPRRPWGTGLAAAAAVVLVAVAGHAAGLVEVDRALFSPADGSGRPTAPVTAPATSPTTPPRTVPTTGTAVRPATSPSASASSRPSATRPAGTATRPAGRTSDGTFLATGTVVGLEPLAQPGYRVRHADLVLRVARASAAAGDAAASSFLVRSGLASPDGLSLEAVDRPGYFVVVDGGSVVLRADDGTSAFETSATFLASPAPGGRGVTFAPFGRRSERVRPVAGVLSARTASTGSADDAAFTVRPGLYTRPVNPERTTGSVIGPAGRCVDVWGADNGGPGSPAGVWDCEPGAADQRWSHELDFSLRTLGRCLDVVGADNGGAGSEVVLWDCEPTAEDQKWVQAPDGTLRSRASGLCLHVVGGGTANGTRLELATCTAAPDQQFRLT